MKEFSVLENKVKELLEEWKILSSEKSTLHKNISELLLEKGNLQNHINELQSQLQSIKEDKTILETDKRNINDNYNALKEERDNILKEKENLLKELEATKIERDGLKTNIEKFEKDCLNLMEENDNLKKELQTISSNIDNIKKENEEVQSSVFSLISKIDKAMIDDNISDKLNVHNNITNLDLKKFTENVEKGFDTKDTIEDTCIEDKEAQLEELKANIVEESFTNTQLDDTKKEEYNNIQKNYNNVANIKVNEDDDPFSSAYDANWDSDIDGDKTEIIEEEKEVSHQDNNSSYDFDVNEEDQYMFGDDDEEDFFFDDDSK